MTDRKHQFLWLDLETTGLDPRECQILEWAAVLAADDAGGDMSVIDQYTGVIHVPHSKPPKMDDFVRNMHTTNGLLSECHASSDTLNDAEAALVALAESLAGPEPRGIVLAGASVHFDLGFLRVHMPTFAACLSHRVFDVSTLKLADAVWMGAAFAKPEAKHRALDDVLCSLAEAKALRDRRYS